eukprot:COSAG01_NODE_50773_length_360_cov_1.187739_1_plen_89_part_00
MDRLELSIADKLGCCRLHDERPGSPTRVSARPVQHVLHDLYLFVAAKSDLHSREEELRCAPVSGAARPAQLTDPPAPPPPPPATRAPN